MKRKRKQNNPISTTVMEKEIENIEPELTTTYPILSNSTSCTTSYRIELVYRIFLGDDALEYYTFKQPFINGNHILLEDLFVKSSIEETIVNEVITNYYKDTLPSNEKDKEVLLTSGIVIKTFYSQELDWLSNTFEDAYKTTQAESLKVYKELVPQILERLNTLPNTKITGKSKINKEDELIDL